MSQISEVTVLSDCDLCRAAREALITEGGWQRWLTARRHFHRLSLANQLLVALQRPGATRVAGQRAWRTRGHQVRPGESPLRVWVPAPGPGRRVLGLVFDRSQVTPTPAAPERSTSRVAPCGLAWAFAPLVVLAGDLGCAVRVERMPTGEGGAFCLSARQITLNRAHSVDGQVRTLIRELGHALTRWDTDLEELELRCSEAVVIVESIVYAVCTSIRLDVSADPAPCLSWSPSASVERVERVAAGVDRIAKRIERTLEGGSGNGG